MTYGLDTSVLMCILTGEPQELAETVSAHIAGIIANGGMIEIGELAVSEAYYSLQHFYGLTKENSIKSLRGLLGEQGISFTPEAKAALETPEAWKARPGFVDRMIAGGYAAKGRVTLSCEKDFRRLNFTEVIS